MKKVMFLVMVAVMPFISCSSDDDSSGGQDQLVGKWRESKSTEKSYVDGEFVETEVTETTDKDYFEVEFKADGTFSEFYFESYLSNGDSGEEIVETSTDGGTYEVKGDKIILHYNPYSDGSDGGTFEAQFSVSASSLTVISIYQETYDNKTYRDETTTELYRL